MLQKLTSVLLIVITGMMLAGSTPLSAAEPSLPIVQNEGNVRIEIYPTEHKLIVIMEGAIVKTYPVAVGNPSTPTPVGEYKVVYKGINWGPAFGTRWIGLDVPWGTYGIHGTNKPHSIGRHVSHGCIRMRNRDVEDLYKIIPVGTTVEIHGHVLGGAQHDPRAMAEGDVGAEVQLIQNRLQHAGYYRGVCDGKFRSSTTEALKKFQRDNGLIPNGVVSLSVYEKLGLLE